MVNAKKTSYFFFLFHILFFSKMLDAKTNTNITTLNIDAYQLIGSSKMTWFWFDLYHASFYTVTGKYHSGIYPKLLTIAYLRNIDADDLVSATIEQWQDLQYSKNDISRWRNVVSSLWPDIQKADTLSIEVISSDEARFFYNQQLLTSINSKGFADAFISIWISEKTSQPELRNQLLGISSY